MSASKPTANKKRAVGRPRSQASKQSILDATARLLEDTCLKNLAIECIAREAGVGKATIYRWWPNKAAIVIDAMFAAASSKSAFEKSTSASEAISKHLALFVAFLSGPQGRIVGQIIAEGQSDPDVLESFRRIFLMQRRAAVREILEFGMEQGEFSPDLDIELATDLIYGPVWFRLLAGHQPLDQTFAKSLSVASIGALKTQ
jgi:AcrR family transcriptional regulator